MLYNSNIRTRNYFLKHLHNIILSIGLIQLQDATTFANLNKTFQVAF